MGATDERQNKDGSDHEDDKSDDELLEQVRKIHLYISEKFNYYQLYQLKLMVFFIQQNIVLKNSQDMKLIQILFALTL